MILINLLPQELRIKETKKLNIPYRLIAVCVFVIFLGLSIYNLFLYVSVREEFRKLEKQWSAIEAKSIQADQLEAEVGGGGMAAEIDFYDTFIEPPLETAHILNLVSDLTPKSAWLAELKFERVQKEMMLVLNGVSESAGKSSKLIEIQNFSNSLKDQMEQVTSASSPSAMNQPSVNPASAFVPTTAVSTGLPVSDQKIEAIVTTTSQAGDEERAERMQFTAAFKTKGFVQK
ncbi:MAG: hypothetical protein A3C35_05925 [Omnitrophica bacterium RIFCSPHIGHO2_02_FULL_46_11]|nr:MAG: hypothetical protein A3C35_05925 [Omnitrophica bacterium RIFCSPHIGHO2_02_FULL_46_11]OGW86346.1 MAG: hypothetical protein A3A81_07680 [Omnitrophica bacterium RIFCSPLOWO2_01_FULL_45_10b]